MLLNWYTFMTLMALRYTRELNQNASISLFSHDQIMNNAFFTICIPYRETLIPVSKYSSVTIFSLFVWLILWRLAQSMWELICMTQFWWSDHQIWWECDENAFLVLTSSDWSAVKMDHFLSIVLDRISKATVLVH